MWLEKKPYQPAVGTRVGSAHTTALLSAQISTYFSRKAVCTRPTLQQRQELCCTHPHLRLSHRHQHVAPMPFPL